MFWVPHVYIFLYAHLCLHLSLVELIVSHVNMGTGESQPKSHYLSALEVDKQPNLRHVPE